MKRHLWICLSLLLTAGLFADADTDYAVSVQKVVRRIAKESIPAVVRVDVFNNDGSQRSFGSGFIFKQTGKDVFVLTNYHVVSQDLKMKVTLYDDRQFDPVLLGRDERTDLAVMKFSSDEKLKMVTLGDSDKIEVGDWSIGIGNPFGFNGSVSLGVVSALGRSMAGRSYATDYIQTDTAINPGNSGGPLLNIYGEVIGINSWIASMTGENTGLSFAIPINTAKKVLEPLINNREVTYAWLGVLVNSLTDRIFRERLGITFEHGAYIVQIVENSPADNGALGVGDIILSVDGKEIKDANTLVWTISKYAPGDTVSLEVYGADKKVRTVKLTLGTRPGAGTQAQNSSTPAPATGVKVVFLGAELFDLNDSLREQYKLGATQSGPVITGIDAGSPAEQYGLMTGDVVIKINQTDITSTNGVSVFMADNQDKGSGYFYVKVLRKGRELLVGVVGSLQQE